MMTIETIKSRVKEVGQDYDSKVTDWLLDYLDRNLNIQPHTPEILQNTFDLIPDMFERQTNL